MDSPTSFSLSTNQSPTSTPLLSPPPSPSTMAAATTTSSSLLIILLLLSVSFAFAFAMLNSSSPLSTPTVILISSDAFRFGYQHKTHLPNINRLISGGTEASLGLVPVFPTLTFPNHYSIATGLYPQHHGIIDNHFTDPVSGAHFSPDSHDPWWWLGEPIWETVVRHGLNAATYYWPGSEVHRGPWTCPEEYCHHYNKTMPYENRVDSVLGYFDLPKRRIPALITLYFEEPDLKGHEFGPDDSEVTAAVAVIDSMVGRLLDGLEKRGVFGDVTVILVGDHGMVGICPKKYIFLEDLGPWIEIDASWLTSYSPLFAVRPPPGVSPAEVVGKLNEGLSSGKVENGDKLKVFLKEDLPERLHYSASYRIPPIIGLLEEGYKVEQNRSCEVKCGGDHGYDNAFFSMRSIFVGHGPRFAKGRKVPPFENVEIYNVIASVLNLNGAPNNGSASFAESILLCQLLDNGGNQLKTLQDSGSKFFLCRRVSVSVILA